MPDLLPPIYDGVRAKPTIFDGILMDSDTEASFAAWLKSHQNPYKYHQNYRGIGGKYELDFGVGSLRAEGTLYVEIKPRRDDMPGWLFENREYVDEKILDRLMIIRESIPNASLAAIFWNDGDESPRLFFLHRGYRWRLINEDQGSRLPW